MTFKIKQKIAFAISTSPADDIYISELCSGITRGRVLNGELHTQRFQILSYFVHKEGMGRYSSFALCIAIHMSR